MKLNNKNKNNNNINNNMKDNSKNNGGGTQKKNSSRYGIKSNKCPPQVKYLIAFEEDMVDLVCQRDILENNKIVKQNLTPADKTSNMYKLTKDKYNHLLDNAVTTTY